MHVSSPLRGEPDYLLLYTRDITDLYERRTDMIKAFITIDLLTAILSIHCVFHRPSSDPAAGISRPGRRR
jgi:hypothetical protein